MNICGIQFPIAIITKLIFLFLLSLKDTVGERYLTGYNIDSLMFISSLDKFSIRTNKYFVD